MKIIEVLNEKSDDVSQNSDNAYDIMLDLKIRRMRYEP